MHQQLALSSADEAVAYLALLQEHSQATWATAEMMKRVGAHERAVLRGEAPRRPLVSNSRSFKALHYEINTRPDEGALLRLLCAILRCLQVSRAT